MYLLNGIVGGYSDRCSQPVTIDQRFFSAVTCRAANLLLICKQLINLVLFGMLPARHLLRCPVVKSSTQAAQTVLAPPGANRVRHQPVTLMAAKADAGEEPWVLWCVSSHSCTLCGWHMWMYARERDR